MTATATDCLRAHSLELWRGERRLFHGLNLSVEPGELLHVSGPNGSGKTSLLRVLCGLVPPEHGQVLWNGAPIGRARHAFHAALCYVAHQDALHDDLTALENLRWGIALHGAGRPAGLQAKIEEIGLGHAADVKAYALSAGQKRRLALARAQLGGKRLWIMDEPLANLDTGARAWCEAMLAAHVGEGGMVIATSHQRLCEGVGGRRELALAA